MYYIDHDKFAQILDELMTAIEAIIDDKYNLTNIEARLLIMEIEKYVSWSRSFASQQPKNTKLKPTTKQ